MTQAALIASLPSHLRSCAQQQSMTDYSEKEHATWRFIMYYLQRNLKHSAHEVYLQGLKRAGISTLRIPSIDTMNKSLAELGWQAVGVRGFVPPAVFMEFQAQRILPVALDMRRAEHIFYTPAPDIVHEAAGHAPFLSDVDYAEFLQRFGELGMKAVSNRHDEAVYKAVRALSEAKLQAVTGSAEMAIQQQALEQLIADAGPPSEAALLSRLHWWTVEYGLVGQVDDYRLFGAGLLSSLGESQTCLNDAAVRKIWLSVDVINHPYDISRQQPQLFVTDSCKHLSQVLEEFAASMAFKRGGASAVRQAMEAGSICTAEYDTGLQISGVFTNAICDAVDNLAYVQTTGPSQLALAGQQLADHGSDAHAEGFGSPVGRLVGLSRCLSDYSADELKAEGIYAGRPVELKYLSGISVKGCLRGILRAQQRNIVLSFDDCTVSDRTGQALFKPEWGRYDLAAGSSIRSVFGGCADRSSENTASQANHVVGGASGPAALDAAYGALNAVGGHDTETAQLSWRECRDQLEQAMADFPDEWLLCAIIASDRTSPLAGMAQRKLQHQASAGRDSEHVRAVNQLIFSSSEQS